MSGHIHFYVLVLRKQMVIVYYEYKLRLTIILVHQILNLNLVFYSVENIAVSAFYLKPKKAIMKRSGHASIHRGVRTYQREDPHNKIAISNVLSCSKFVVTNFSDKNEGVP